MQSVTALLSESGTTVTPKFWGFVVFFFKSLVKFWGALGDCVSREWQCPSKLHHKTHGKLYCLLFKPGFQFLADLLNSNCQPA